MFITISSLPLRKTPVQARTFVAACALFAVSLFADSMAHAQEAWSEQRVADAAREHAPLAVAAQGIARRAEAGLVGLAPHPNPTVDWERQESFAPNAQAQDLVRATLPIDLSGRRPATRALAALEAERLTTDAETVGREAAARALSLFYRALAAERSRVVLTNAQATLDEAARVLESRRSVGEVSGYERARLVVAVELGRSRLARARLDHEVALETLAALLGRDDVARLTGDFSPAGPAPVDTLVERAGANRPELRSLERREALADRAESASRRAWIPAFAIFGGYNRQDGSNSGPGSGVGHGYTAGVRVDVPLFDHGQGLRARSAAERDSLSDYAGVIRNAVRAEVSAARSRLEGLLAERARLSSATRDATELLLRAADAGFRGGERSLVELLDARGAALELALEQLALDLEIRLADVELRFVTGEI